MKIRSKLYYFLGSVYLAIILIAVTTFFVIAGTFIESITKSHKYASYFTYSSPLFALLLWGFFVNILFSATRRWPFKVHHIPFLITHFGLLMILAGSLAKIYFGTQGSMSIVEGSGSHMLFDQESQAIYLQQKHLTSSIKYSLKSLFKKAPIMTPEAVRVRLIDYAAHSSTSLNTWFKGDHLVISGVKPLAIYTDHFTDNKLPVSGKIKLTDNAVEWNIYALRSSDVRKTIEKIYTEDNEVCLTSPQHTCATFKLTDLPQQAATLSQIDVNLMLNFSPIEGFREPKMLVSVGSEEFKHQLTIALDHSSTLQNINATTAHLGSLPFKVDVRKIPSLAFIEDDFGDMHIIAMDPHGRIWQQAFAKDKIDTFIVYDQGYMGYALRAEIPFGDVFSRQAVENFAHEHLVSSFQNALKSNDHLSLPLQLLKTTCEKSDVDFAKFTMQYLRHLDSSHCWIYPIERPLNDEMTQVFQKLTWRQIPAVTRQGCLWCQQFISAISKELENGKDVVEILKNKHWPLLTSLKNQRDSLIDKSEYQEELLAYLTQQLFSAAQMQPPFEDEVTLPQSAEESMAWHSSLLKLYGISYKSLIKQAFEDSQPPEKFVEIETKVIPTYAALPPLKKLEDNLPKITLHMQKGNTAQAISLRYDKFGTELAWPVLNGEYLISFQPEFTEIPYHIRLRNARQINYPNSMQPYSYESDIVITDRRTGFQEEKTISMNNVHETKDGYRFYLSSMTPSTETALKRVQIVVNHDPAKYWLTYTGAVILAVGIILLFIMWPYRKT